jgi:hypothetical protein
MTHRPDRRARPLPGATAATLPPRRTVVREQPPVEVADRRGLRSSPWRALCPSHVLEMRDPDLLTLQRLPSGTAVALVSDRWLSRGRLRRRARLAGVRIERELVVVPTTRSPIMVLDDEPLAVRHFWTSVAAVPPGVTRAHGPLSAVLLAMRVVPWRWTGAVAPGRVLVGSRR